MNTMHTAVRLFFVAAACKAGGSLFFIDQNNVELSPINYWIKETFLKAIMHIAGYESFYQTHITSRTVTQPWRQSVSEQAAPFFRNRD